MEQAVKNAISSLEREGAAVETVCILTLPYAQSAEMITIITEASAIHQQNFVERGFW